MPAVTRSKSTKPQAIKAKPATLKRADLLEVIEAVAPALATSSFVKQLTHFYFDRKQVVAYNDQIAMWHPLETGIEGLVPGQVLIDFLKAARADGVSLESQGDQLTVKVGKAMWKCSMMDKEDFLFKSPDLTPEVTLTELGDFISNLDRASVSAGVDPTKPAFFGVAIDLASNSFFSTDNRSATSATIGGYNISPDSDEAYSMSPLFSMMLVEMSKKREPVELNLHPGWAHAVFKGGLNLFGKVPGTPDIGAYEAMFEQVPTEGYIELSDKPSLDRCIAEMNVVITRVDEKVITIQNEDGLATMTAKGNFGEVSDQFSLEGLPDFTVVVPPELLERALPLVEDICVVEGAFVAMKGECVTHLIGIVHTD
jgi:hypothetical protein